MALPATAPAPARQRIAFVCPSGAPIRQLGDILFREVLSRGHRVLAVASAFGEGDAQVLAALGAEHVSVAPEAAGFKLFADWKSISALKEALKNWAPDVVVACGGRTMVHGALAAKGAGVSRIILAVDGLPEHRFAGALASDEMPAWRYGQALREASAAVFSNHDDLALLQKLGVVPATLPVAVIAGTGVELDDRPPLPLPPLDHGLRFLMIGGLDRRRGIMEYCEAAAKLRARSPSSRFRLAALPEEAAQPLDMGALEARDGIELADAADEHHQLLGAAHVFVYPGYAEGMPRPLLQALAAGRPIVTTDVAGCREAVEDGVNGCLVRPRDADALAEAMEGLLRRPDRIPAMARASRAKAERFETAAAVRASWLDLLHLA